MGETGVMWAHKTLGKKGPNSEHLRPRSKGDTVVNRVFTQGDMVNPMESGRMTGMPTARAAEFSRGYEMSEEANASSRKATGIHNRLDGSQDPLERALTSDG
jgi:hypothetical protein